MLKLRWDLLFHLSESLDQSIALKMLRDLRKGNVVTGESEVKLSREPGLLGLSEYLFLNKFLWRN